MIDSIKAGVGFNVFYQRPHMPRPEYGVITSIGHAPDYIHVLFIGDMTSKACRPRDLHWPPVFCAADRANVEGQPFAPSPPRRAGDPEGLG